MMETIETEDYLNFDGDELIIAVPEETWERMIDIENICLCWSGNPIWVVWPSVGNKRSVELRNEKGKIVFEATLGPLFGGPYTPAEAVNAGRAVYSVWTTAAKDKEEVSAKKEAA